MTCTFIISIGQYLHWKQSFKKSGKTGLQISSKKENKFSTGGRKKKKEGVGGPINLTK